MTDKDTSNRVARRKALAELRRRHAEEFRTIQAGILAELRGEKKPSPKRKPRAPKK